MVCIVLVSKMLVNMLYEQFVYSHLRHTISHIISNANASVVKMVNIVATGHFKSI